MKMKKELKVKIRNKVWARAWSEYKSDYTMQQMAEILGASLPTFFRAIKKEYGKSKKRNQ